MSIENSSSPDAGAIAEAINESAGLQVCSSITLEELERLLAEKLNEMIRSDFSGLVQLLYRIDVSEKKLSALLKENPGSDTGLLIARMMIQRQWEKILTRRTFKPDADVSDEERW